MGWLDKDHKIRGADEGARLFNKDRSLQRVNKVMAELAAKQEELEALKAKNAAKVEAALLKTGDFSEWGNDSGTISWGAAYDRSVDKSKKTPAKKNSFTKLKGYDGKP